MNCEAQIMKVEDAARVCSWSDNGKTNNQGSLNLMDWGRGDEWFRFLK